MPDALKVSEPKFAVPADANRIAPLVAVIVSRPPTLNESVFVSVRLKLAALKSAVPLTAKVAPPPTVSVTTPVDASVSVPAVFVPTISVAESS